MGHEGEGGHLGADPIAVGPLGAVPNLQAPVLPARPPPCARGARGPGVGLEQRLLGGERRRATPTRAQKSESKCDV